jgi:hypothetical protein
MSISFVEHKEFQKNAITMTIAGLLSLLALHVLFESTRLRGAIEPFVLPMLAASIVYVLPSLRGMATAARLALLAGIVLFFGGICKAIYGPDREPLMIGTVLIFGLFFLHGARPASRIFSSLWGILVTGVSVFVLLRFAASSTLHEMPSWVLAGFSGASFGLVSSLGLLPRHIQYQGDRVRAAHARLSSENTEISTLNDRALSLWEKSEQLLSKNPSARSSLEGSMLRFFNVSARLQSSASEGSLAESVTSQIKSLEEKREKSSDEQTRKEYDLALQSLSAQQEYAHQINITRERTLARLHSYLATMEKIRLAVINQQAASVAEDSTSIQSILRELEDAGRLFDAERDALNAIEKQATS